VNAHYADAPDFKPILSKVKSLSPDVVYMVSYVMDASLLMKQIKELRLDASSSPAAPRASRSPSSLTTPRTGRPTGFATASRA